MRFLLWHRAAESARRFPDRHAVQASDATLTYRELDVASNGLAQLFSEYGVGRGERVGMWMPKSSRSIVTMLGTGKAGAAYVPVDPSAPVARASFILANAEVSVLVTSRKHLDSLRDELPNLPTLRLILVADGEGSEAELPTLGWSDIIPAVAPPPLPSMVEYDPAYILYTSGSTGTPKGVVISHRNALAFVDWALDSFEITEHDRLSGHAPLHFDLSVFDVYAALHTGACVIPVPDRVAPFPAELARWLESERISICYCVPSALVRLLKHGELERFGYQALHTILFAGEVFPVRHLAEVMEKFSHSRFYNLYGPTETNVCTWMEVPRPLRVEDGELSIGASCRNFDCFALTADNRRASVGEEGELVVRGPGVMLGYWKLPERTAQNLVQNPLNAAFADPIYRTGDIVRPREDGAFDFLGRRDHMVKTRGYRVELEEIEHVLHAHPRVRNAAVVAIPDEELGARLRAAVVVEGDEPISSSELASHCATKLPPYAVPESFMLLSDLPTTSTGKVDRRSLAESLRQPQSPIPPPEGRVRVS